MDVWIIADGEKAGPFHDFDIRGRIQSGELTAGTVGWHEGLDAWKPLAEMDLFRREFERPAPESRPHEEAQVRPPGQPPLPQAQNYLRRFWARWFDLTLYSGLWWLAMWAAAQDIGAALMNPWLMFFQYVPWFAFEALLLHYAGTTPGKWLLGLKVLNLDGSRLDLAATTRRSARVLFTGIGFGWSLLAVFCQTLSLFTARRLGSTVWDHIGGHRVIAASLSPGRVAIFLAGFALAVLLHSIVISPALFRIAGEQNPQMKEAFERIRPWHLPERSPRN